MRDSKVGGFLLASIPQFFSQLFQFVIPHVLVLQDVNGRIPAESRA